MKAPREYRRWINWLRAREAKLTGKRNGATGWTDDPYMETMLETSKRALEKHACRRRYGQRMAA